MPHIEDVLLHALAQDGDRYVFCAAVDFADPDPRDFDCSGLVSWACGRAGVAPTQPHSAFMQAQLCMRNSLEVTVEQAVATRGALLFKFPDVTDVLALTTRPKGAHVAWSLGNGTTIEAASPGWGVGTFSSNPKTREWTHGGLLPGVEYTDRPQVDHTEMEEEMATLAFYQGINDGEVHAYVINGAIAKHLSPEALGLHRFFGTAAVGSLDKPLGKEWQDGVAIVDGPLQNVGSLL
jgi:cell wall-associated NlpC family hydrolase